MQRHEFLIMISYLVGVVVGAWLGWVGIAGPVGFLAFAGYHKLHYMRRFDRDGVERG